MPITIHQPVSSDRVTTAISRKWLLSTMLVLTTLVMGITVQAAVYKIVDGDGNVSYTDIAPTDAQQREESTVELEIKNTYDSSKTNPAAAFINPTTDEIVLDESGTESSQPTDTTQASYRSLTIISPQPNADVRENSGNVTLSVQLDPVLRAGDNIRFFLDGKPVGTVAGTSLALQNIDRGTHTVAAVVLDGTGKPRISSSTTSFALQRYAPLLAPNRKPPPPPPPKPST